MDDKPIKFLKLPRETGFCRPPNFSHCKNQYRPSNLYRHFFKLTIFPTVHACDGEGTAKVLELKRPKLFVTDEEIQERVSKETGLERVQAMFKQDNFDHWHPDLVNALTVTKGTGLGTFLVMSVLGSIHGRQEFIKSHQHVKFKTKFRAVRAYRDAIFVSGMKVGGLYGLKVALFTFTFFMSSTCVAVYKNKTSALDYTVGGLVAGSLFKFNLGPKGLLAGGIIGAVIGTMAGLAISGMQHATGETQDVRHSQMIHDQILHEKEAALISTGELTREDVENLHVVNLN